MHSYRLTFATLLIAVLALAPIATLAEVPLDVPQFSTVVSSADIRDPLTTDKLAKCMAEAREIMKVDPQSTPRIIVLQLSQSEAKKLGMDKTVLLSNRGTRGPTLFYEVWIIGPHAQLDMARAVVGIYEQHYGVTYTEAERATTVTRVMQRIGSTIDVQALRDEMQAHGR